MHALATFTALKQQRRAVCHHSSSFCISLIELFHNWVKSLEKKKVRNAEEEVETHIVKKNIYLGRMTKSGKESNKELKLKRQTGSVWVIVRRAMKETF